MMTINVMQNQVAYQVLDDSNSNLFLKGCFIVFEGLDGAGTTTQTALLANRLDKNRYEVIATKEPTDGIWGGIIRGILKGEIEAHALSLCYAFMADRIDHIQKLEVQTRRYKSPVVISDRYHLSYLAYQQMDTNKSLSWLLLTQQGLPLPDITFFLDVPPLVCYERMKKSRLTRERYENIETLERIHTGYSDAIDLLLRQGQNIIILDGTMPIEKLHNQIVAISLEFLNT